MLRKRNAMMMLLAAAALAVGISSSRAADVGQPSLSGLQAQISALQGKLNTLPLKAPSLTAAAYSWTGAYFGADIGYGFAAHQLNLFPANDQANAVFAALGNPGSLAPDAAGAVGGFHGGYEFVAAPNVVLGAEAKWEWTNITSQQSQGLAGMATVGGNYRVDWDGSIDAKAGVLISPQAMLYAVGGFSFGNISQGAQVVCAFGPQFCFSNSIGNVHKGWNVGAGFEYALTSNVTARVEYRYTDLGNSTFLMTGQGAQPATYNSTDDAAWNSITAGLSYKF